MPKIEFDYSAFDNKDKTNWEKQIRDFYKPVFDKFPNSTTVFTWLGTSYSIGSDIDLAEFHYVDRNKHGEQSKG